MSFQASATGLVGAGGVLAEFDNNWAPNVIIANVRTFLRSVPVRF